MNKPKTPIIGTCNICSKKSSKISMRRGLCSWCNKKSDPKWLEQHNLRSRLAPYKLTTKQYKDMLESQGNKCKLCLKDFNGTHKIDHDHATGKVRGLLCDSCNIALGLLREDPLLFGRAVAYLKYFGSVDRSCNLLTARHVDLETNDKR